MDVTTAHVAPTTAPAAHHADGLPIHGSPLLLLAAVLAYGGWRISLWLHPWTKCSKCQGEPRSYGAVYRQSYSLCPKCGGTGRQLRRGARNP